MNYRKKNFLVLIVPFIIFNCSSSNTDDENDTVITYETDIQNIINNNCVQCHGNPPSQGAPVSFTTYDQVKTNINDILIRINSSSNPMPPTGQISSNLRAKIQEWKDGGLLEN